MYLKQKNAKNGLLLNLTKGYQPLVHYIFPPRKTIHNPQIVYNLPPVKIPQIPPQQGQHNQNPQTNIIPQAHKPYPLLTNSYQQEIPVYNRQNTPKLSRNS